MQRLTISLDDDIAQAFDDLMIRQGYRNRSEAFRDVLRNVLAQEQLTQAHAQCVAVVSYSYDHHRRQLSTRMVEHQHEHQGLVISTMHVHVDHDQCVETVVMRGPSLDVIRLAQETIAETGVEHGHIHLIPVETPATHQ